MGTPPVNLVNLQQAVQIMDAVNTTLQGMGVDLAVGIHAETISVSSGGQTVLAVPVDKGLLSDLQQQGAAVLPALVRIFVEPRTAPSQFPTLSGAPVDHTVPQGPQTQSPVMHETAVPVSVMNMGREIVYSTTNLQGQNIAPSLPQKAGRPDSPSVAAGLLGGGVVTPEKRPEAGVRASLATPTQPHQAQAVVRQTQKSVPEIVRDVLARLDLLPAGVKPEEALPRFREVIRLWQEGARNSDLPPDVVRVVNHFLTSAVLLTNLSAATRQAQGPAANQQGPQTQQGLAARPENIFSRSADLPSLHLSSTNIAQAVMAILTGSRTVPQAPLLPQGLPMPPRQPGEAPRQLVAPQTAGVARTSVPVDGNKTPRGELGLRAQAQPGTQQPAKEGAHIPRALGRSEEPRREEGLDEPNLLPEAPHERESSGGSHGGEEEGRDQDAPFAVALEALAKGGFIDRSTDRIQLRAVQAFEAARLIDSLSRIVPQGSDLMDLLDLLNRQNVGWAETKGPVNAALSRLANYRTRGNGTKEDALLEPLRDVVIILGLSEMGLSPEEVHVLEHYEAHVPIVEMFLENAAWFSRLGADRGLLESEFDDARRQWVDHHKRQGSGLPN